jgi:hypothetical protein
MPRATNSHRDRCWAKALALPAGKIRAEAGPIFLFENTLNY